MVQTQFRTKIKILGNYVRDRGIIHQIFYVNTPRQNGIAKRKNRHLLEVARSLVFTTRVRKYFWNEAVLTTTY